MAYDRLLKRALDILVEHKFLLVLGILAALGGGSSTTSWTSSGSGGGGSGGAEAPSLDPESFPPTMPFGQDWLTQFPDLDALPFFLMTLIGGLICFLLIIAIIVWVISTIASGSLIAGVDAVEDQQPTGFSLSWSEGWQRVWRLVGINLIPTIPILIMLLAGLFYFGAFIGLALFDSQGIMAAIGASAIWTVFCFACIGLPITMAMVALRTFAYRACMLEDLGIVDSYRRGWAVLRANLGAAFALFLLQIGLNIVLAIVLIIPSIFIVLCCILWPLFLVISGTITAYFSTVWTLAWREWTGQPNSTLSIPASTP